MEEDDNTARERQQLRKEREKLQIAINNIKDLENSAEDDEDFSTWASTQPIDVDYAGDEDDHTMEEDEGVV